jgi:L-alanine-DL-glutamate epimerase-like enolase superfamily enzyme
VRRLTLRKEIWPIRDVFSISRGSRTQIEVVVAEIHGDGHVGRGESTPSSRYGESVESVLALAEGLRGEIEAGLECCDLLERLPAGAARNALDCALWDWEAKRADVRVWEAAGLPEPKPSVTAYTLSVNSPEKMGEAARKAAHYPLLKIKLAGKGDLERMAAVRTGAPDSRLIIDANEAWTVDEFVQFSPRLAEMGVEMIEQPLPSGEDDSLRGLDRPVPVCADESCHVAADVERLRGAYDFVNIKLDKSGGLTEAILLAGAAREAGFRVMVGCMLGTSLAMAPATLLGTYAEFVDLDGPLLLDKDREPGLRFGDGKVWPPDRPLWG